jgi:hypothetical protein
MALATVTEQRDFVGAGQSCGRETAQVISTEISLLV